MSRVSRLCRLYLLHCCEQRISSVGASQLLYSATSRNRDGHYSVVDIKLLLHSREKELDCTRKSKRDNMCCTHAPRCHPPTSR